MFIIYLWGFISFVLICMGLFSAILDMYGFKQAEYFYLFLKTSCHQVPTRCFWINDSNLGLCARCFGFYLSQVSLLFINKKYFYFSNKGAQVGGLLFFVFMILHPLFPNQYLDSNMIRFMSGFWGGLGLIGIGLFIYRRKESALEQFLTKRKKWGIIFLIIAIYFLSFGKIVFAQNGFVTLRSGTLVLVEIMETMDTAYLKTGMEVKFKVARPVRVDDHVVIFNGSLASGVVAKCESASGWGQKGKLEITVDSCFAVDGQEISLSASKYLEGEGKTGAATAVGVGTALLCLPLGLTGFAVTGEEGKIPAGMQIKARVEGDYKIKLLTEDRTNQVQNEQLKEAREYMEKLRKEKEEREKKEKEEEERRRKAGQPL
jgi:uncharacterized membrane protein